jgi:hypothetical protein
MMRAVNPMRTRRRAIDELRVTIRCLPRATRVAMLHGISTNPIIVGAYSTRDGICPMLAAHRAGGRTNLIAFAEAWDRFGQGTGRRRRARRATERELLVLRSHLEASLLEDVEAPPLASAIAEHRELVARRPDPRSERDRAAHAEPRSRPGQTDTRGRHPRPGSDVDRSRDLRHAPGWAWTRLFRRYDEYAQAVSELEPGVAERPVARPLASA